MNIWWDFRWGDAKFPNVLDGHAQVELDGSANAAIAQDIPAAPGRTYDFSLFLAPRVPVNAASNPVEIWWNGAPVDVVALKKNGWSMRSYVLTATTNTARLELRGAGISDGLGGVVDHLQLGCRIGGGTPLPQFTSTPVGSATVGTPWEYALATDVVAGNRHLVLEQAPAGVTLDADGVLRWAEPAAGDWTIRARLDDGCGGTQVQTFTLQVTWPAGCPQ